MTLEEQLKEIEECFEWERVHKTMVALNWEWFTLDIVDPPTTSIPTIAQIKANAMAMLNMAYSRASDKDYPISTGGLIATCIVNNGKKYLRLSFEVDHWESTSLYTDDDEPSVPHRLDISTVENRNIQPTL